MLRSRAFVHVELLSFSLYLWHWPVFVILKYLNYPLATPATGSAAMATTYVLAIASHASVEQSVRRARNGVAIALGMTAVGAAAAAVLVATSAPPPLTAARATWFGNLYAVGIQVDPKNPGRTFAGVSMTGRKEGEQAPGITEGVRGGTPSGPELVTVMGDSHALMWANQISDACQRLGVAVRFWCADGTSPFVDVPPRLGPGSPGLLPEQLLDFDKARLSWIERQPPGVLVLAARWSSIGDLDRGLAFVRHARSIGWRIVLVKQPPELWFGDVGALEYVAALGWKPGVSPDLVVEESVQRHRFDAATRFIDALATDDPGIVAIEVADLLAASGDARVLLASGTVSRYVDDDHLSEEGAALFNERLQGSIGKALGK